jgi:hypothetical protein
MCRVICDGHCRPARRSVADRIPGPGRVLVALVAAGYHLGRWAVPPLARAIVAGSVLAWRWHTGAVMRPTWRGRPRLARHVRATARSAATGIGAAALADWRVTLAALAALAAAGSVSAMVARDRRRQRTTAAALAPRRVRVRVGPPAAARRPAGALAAEPATTSATWPTRSRVGA